MKFLPTITLFVSLTAGSFARAADQTPAQIADQELPSLLTIYKDVHSHPELSTQEEQTSALVAKELKAAGCEVTDHIGKYQDPQQKGYGVVGVMKNGDGPVVLVRTDMDALPVQEETGLPYASKVTAKNEKGDEVHVMHACGHDIISRPLSAWRANREVKGPMAGTILFVAQPAEELGGARVMLNDGLYRRFPKPDFALGFHDNAQLETNQSASRPAIPTPTSIRST